MINSINSFFSSLPRSISSAIRSSTFTVSQHKSTPNTVKTSSPFSPSNSPASATTIFKVKNSYTESGLQRPTSYTQSSIEKTLYIGLYLMWLSVWCSILQSMAFNQPGIWLNIFLRHLTGLRHHRQYKMNNQDLCLMWLSV